MDDAKLDHMMRDDAKLDHMMRDDAKLDHMMRDDARLEDAMLADAMVSWVAACTALVTAEQSGLPEAHLEELADEVIFCKLRLARERAHHEELMTAVAPAGPEQLMLEGMSIGS
jgi:hypothetical protein